MNEKQQKALEVLKSELSDPFGCVILGEADGYLFIEVDRVTVVVGPIGGFHLPAVRTYPETSRLGEKALDAALDPRHWWNRRLRGKHITGHLTPKVGLDWRCVDPDVIVRSKIQFSFENGIV